MTNDPIREYILENPQNFRIAMAVSEAWLATRNQVVNDFLDKVAAKFLVQYKGWIFLRWQQFFVDAYPSLYLLKPEWEDQYSICLQCIEKGKMLEFGIQRDQEHISGRPHCAELLAAVQKDFPSARSKTWWEAVSTLRSPAADWTSPEVQWRLYQDGTFLEDIAEQLLKVAKASERIVDQLAKQK